MTIEVPEKPFIRLLFRWKGSIWHSVWRPLAIYLAAYSTINLAYRLGFTRYQRELFENAIAIVKNWATVIPLEFILGFFVTYVITNWWAMICHMPSPDQFLYYVNMHINGQDDSSRKIRRTLARWSVLHICLVYTGFCKKVKRRFPDDSYFVRNGLMTEDEFELYNHTTNDYGKWFVPVWWAANLLSRCRREGRLSSIGLEQTSEKLWALKTCCGWLKLYAWINVPLRYIQITAFAVYGYFFIALFTRQVVKETKSDGTIVDAYVPFVLILEFIFYVGWLKVAEENLDPFGTDDDDLSINYVLDRVHRVSFMLVDELNHQNPPEACSLFDGTLHPRLRHTKASYPYRDHIPEAKFVLKLSDDEKTLLPPFDHLNESLPSESVSTGFNPVAKMVNGVEKLFTIKTEDDAVPDQQEASLPASFYRRWAMEQYHN